MNINLKKVFKRMCLVRYFELQVIEAVKKGLISCPVYLSIGQEAISSTISTLTEGYAIFAQHRAHSAYLAYGGNPIRLINELLGRKSGCCQGKGGSPCIQDPGIKMFAHHGLIGENIPLAAGYALATKEKTVAYFGDAAAEEDYALAAMGFSVTHKLPIIFVCENNNLSILTPVKVRRSWGVSNVARSMGLKTSVVEDVPHEIYKHAKDLVKELPAYIEVKTIRHRWHVGVGQDGPPKNDRFVQLRNKISGAAKLEEETKQFVDKLWAEQLRKQ